MAFPSITAQFEKAKADCPWLLRENGGAPCLVLVTGGINDVSLYKIFTMDPSIADKEAWVRQRTKNLVGPYMTTLLQGILKSFPNSRVIVGSYYQVISEHSTWSNVVGPLSTLFGAFAPVWLPLIIGANVVGASIISALSKQSLAFSQEALNGLQQAVAAANASVNSERAFLAVPDFRPYHALGAYASYLWNGTGDDPLYSQREAWCDTHSDEPLHTRLASMGHPNFQGKEAYLSAFYKQLSSFMSVSANPRTITLDVPTTVTITAHDRVTGANIAGQVYVNGTAVASTNTSFTYTFRQTPVRRIDPVTKQPYYEYIDPRVEVVPSSGSGYFRVTISLSFIGGGQEEYFDEGMLRAASMEEQLETIQ